jgi:hypothetical protein
MTKSAEAFRSIDSQLAWRNSCFLLFSAISGRALKCLAHRPKLGASCALFLLFIENSLLFAKYQEAGLPFPRMALKMREFADIGYGDWSG